MGLIFAKDGSIVGADGKVIHFSKERFIHDICEGDACFICGTKPDTTKFNNEHILPNWVLNRYKLHSRPIYLPNNLIYSYGKYTIPCCESCNSRMNEVFEKPIRKYFFETPENRKKLDIGPLLYLWLGLIFLKTHLKDRLFAFNPRAGTSSKPISHLYSWDDLYFLHCIVRAPLTGAELTPNVFGSMLTFPYALREPFEAFDYGDVYQSQAAFIRLEDAAVYIVFNDGSASLNSFMPLLKKISGPVGTFQAREILAELAFLNLHVPARPTLLVDTQNGHLVIDAKFPSEYRLHNFDINLRGEVLYSVMKHILHPNLQIKGLAGEQAGQLIKSGKISFLFDNNRNFIKNGEPYPIEDG